MLNKVLLKTKSNGNIKVANIILVVSAFVWYFYAFNFLGDVIDKAGFSNFEIMGIYGINFLGIAVSAILSASLIYRFKRRITFLRYWMLAGVILSLIPLFIDITPLTVLLIASAVLGAYFGIGMPVCMGYYAAATAVGNRASLGGIIILLNGLGFFLIDSIGYEDTLITAVILATLRAMGLLFLIVLKPNEKQIGNNEKISYKIVFSNRSFLLYFIPWCMFSLVNDLTIQVSYNLFDEDFVWYSSIIENVLAGAFAVVGGFFADSIGRKRLALMGFTLLGVGYAVLGLFPGNFVGWWFYTAVDGIAWGAFCTIFLITIWGDLAHGRSSEKYYAIGSLPFLVSNFARLSIGAYAAALKAEVAVFSFASFFLFLAVLPLIYAPETLPEKHIKEKELKRYIEKAKKEALKAHKMEADNPKTKDEKEDVEIVVNPEDSEEILQKAEKSY